MHALLHRIFCNTATFRYATCIPAAFLLAACSTVSLDTPTSSPAPVVSAQEHVDSSQLGALRTLTAEQDRLYRVADPLLTRNVPLCRGNVRNLIGFSAVNKYSFSSDYVAAAQALGFGEALQITGVLNSSGAAKAGIQKGDVLRSIEGKPVPQGPNAEREASALLGPLVGQLPRIKLGLQRDGKDISLIVPLTEACGFGLKVGNTDAVNAYDDGQRMMVTRGMMNFVRSDTELAYVVAKELAHNALRHAVQQRMTGTVGGIINNLSSMNPDTSMLNGTGGVTAMPQDLDAAADTLSLYMLTRAGYDIDGAAAFWQRLATQYPASVLNGYTAIHPATAYRLSIINRTVADIKSKLSSSSNQTLTP
jgi:hypothetical protein